MSDSFAQYREIIATSRPLTREQEREVGRRAKKGDQRARDTLVVHNLGLVLLTARRYAKIAGPNLEDAVQEGMAGLARATQDFDPDRGVKFITYATWWVRAFMHRYIVGAASSVKRRTGVVAAADYSLDAPLDEDGETSHLDLLADEAPDPESTVAEGDFNARVRLAVSRSRKLTAVGRDIAWNRLAGEDGLRTVGARHGISGEAIRQAEKKVIPILRERLAPFKGELGRSYSGAGAGAHPKKRSGSGKTKEHCRVVGCTNRLGVRNRCGVCGYCQAKGYRQDRAKPLDEPVRIGGVGALPRHACDLKSLSDPDILDAVHEAERRGLLTITTPKDKEQAA